MDLSKLTPGEWVYTRYKEPEPDAEVSGDVTGPGGALVCLAAGNDDAKFISLARAAFNVMLRRGWGVVRSPVSFKWYVSLPDIDPGLSRDLGNLAAKDPYTALVEADKWMQEREAKGK